MHATAILPVLAAGLFLLLTLSFALRPPTPGRARWYGPALFSAAFLGFSLFAVLSEGPTGFWPEHTRNLWGNQIWFDLLLATGVGIYLMAPRASARGMNTAVWLMVVAATGSVGFTAMLARLLYLEARASEQA
jgi:hypothetical protein